MHFKRLPRFTFILLLTLLSHLSCPVWSGTLFVFLFATISSRTVLFTQTGGVLLWLLNQQIHVFPLPAEPWGQEFYLRLFMAAICVSLLFFVRCRITSLPRVESEPSNPYLLSKISGALYAFSILMVGMGLFRWFPASDLIWALIALLYAGSISSIGSCGWHRSVFAYLFSLLVITFTTVAIFEAGVRLLQFDVGRSENIWMPHSKAIFTLRPEGSVVDRLEYSSGQFVDVERKISMQGIRDREYKPKTPDEYRIVAIGDSFTMGAGLKLEDTIPKVLEKLLNSVEYIRKKVSVVNCGVGGYAPWQELIFLQERGVNFDPDMVILQLFPANDVAGSYTKVGKYLHAINRKWEYKLRLFQNQNAFPFRVERWCQNHLKFYRLFLTVFNADGLIQPILSNCRLFPKESYPPIISRSTRDFQYEVCLVNWYPELEEAWDIYAESIREIHDTCQKHNVKLVAYVHGDKNAMRPDYWFNLNKRFPDTPYEKNKDIRLTQELLEEMNIPYVNLLERFTTIKDIEKLYFENDGHFSPYGANVVAEAIRDYLLQKKLLPITQ